MKTPVISIVMPVYNAEKFLIESIDSILQQTFTDFELIIVDDGSVDKSIEIVNSYADTRIKLLLNTHNFIKTLNMGITASKGKYIARMDADDIMLPHRLERLFHYMENNSDIDVCGSWMETFGDGKLHIAKTPINHNDIALNLLKGNALFHPTVIMRKTALQRCKSFPNIYKLRYIYAEDYKLWIDMIRNGLLFSNIPEILLRYRISQNQTSSQHYKKQLYNTLLIQKQYSEYVSNLIVQKDPGLCEYIDNSIQLLNRKKISFHSFQSIIADLIEDYS